MIRRLSQALVIGRSLSPLAHSDRRYKASGRKQSHSKALEDYQRNVSKGENISVQKIFGKPQSRTFLPSQRNCYCKNNSSCYRLSTSRMIVEPVVYLLLQLDEGDALLNDFCKRRCRMRNSGYSVWFICLCDIAWATDVAYGSVAEHIRMLWR